LFGPDETAVEPTGRGLRGHRPGVGRRDRRRRRPPRPRRAGGRVLSEQLCQGWLEGVPPHRTPRLFNCYEAFVHIVDSQFNQYAKWLEVSQQIPWRAPVASFNYLLSSHVCARTTTASRTRPGFIDVVVNKKASVVRVYLPPDANCLLSVADHCLRSRDYVNEGRRKAARAQLAHHGPGDRPLHEGPRHLGVRLQ